MLLLHGGGAVTGVADQETKSADAITGKYWRVLSRPLLKAGYRRAISAVCPLSVHVALISTQLVMWLRLSLMPVDWPVAAVSTELAPS